MAVHDRLCLAIKENPQSLYLDAAKQLNADLSASCQTSPTNTLGASTGRGQPPSSLMNSQMPPGFLSYRQNWDTALPHFVAEHPNDPMVELLSDGRKSIDTLLESLHDTAPTRSYPETIFWELSDTIPQIPRVCDMAMEAIEFITRCRFYLSAMPRLPFHQLTPSERDAIAKHIDEWWRNNRVKTMAEGIRAQLPFGDFNSKVWMAENLARMTNAPGNADHLYGLDVLRSLVRDNLQDGVKSVYAARALTEFKDFSPVDVFFARGKEILGKAGIVYDEHYIWYLTDYGGQREWELMYAIAQKEVEQGLEAGTARVWPALVNCQKARTSRLAIPSLALALSQTRNSGVRNLMGNQPFSYADKAAEYLQQLTGVNFGYSFTGTPEERAAAIQRAQRWWLEEGSDEYSSAHMSNSIKGKFRCALSSRHDARYDLTTEKDRIRWMNAWSCADTTSRAILMCFWFQDGAVAEEALLDTAINAPSNTAQAAKHVLSELWQHDRLSHASRKKIVVRFLKPQLVQKRIPVDGRCQLLIAANSSFPFPKESWVQFRSAWTQNSFSPEFTASFSESSLHDLAVLGSLSGPSVKDAIVRATVEIREGDWSYQWSFGPIPERAIPYVRDVPSNNEEPEKR